MFDDANRLHPAAGAVGSDGRKRALLGRPFSIRCSEKSVLDFLVVRVDRLIGVAAVVRGALLRLPLLRSGVLIELLADGIEGLLQRLGRGLDGCDVAALVLLLQVVDGALDGGLVVRVDLVAQLVQRLFGLIDELIGGVMRVDLVLARLVLGGVLLGLLDGLVDVLLGQVGGGGDGDVLLLAGAKILGADVH